MGLALVVPPSREDVSWRDAQPVPLRRAGKLFFVSLQALVNEKFDQFSLFYGDRLQMRYPMHGDYRDNTTACARKYDLPCYLRDVPQFAPQQPAILTR